MAVVLGDVLTGFSSVPVDMDTVNSASLDFFFIAIALFVTDYLAYVTFYYSAERQMKVLRSEALKHMLHLDIGWYDEHDALQLSSRLTGDTVKIKDGMGQKLGDSFRSAAQFIVGFAIGFARGWDITLCMAAVYAEAGSVAEETLGSIRTVASLNGEKKAIGKFEAKVVEAEKENIILHKMSSVVIGMFIASMFFMYAIGLWNGGWKASQAKASPSDVFAAFFGVLMGTASMAQISPSATAVAKAAGSAEELFAILDTPSVIDAEKDDDGIIPEACLGKIEAVNLNFTYPSRPDAQILRDYNVTIESGQTVAFAGSSGGGKSTLIALLERFYDPTSGTLYLDGRDVKTLNVKWLRSQIGMISQEPVLFATSIFDNIAMGGNDVTREDAIAACKLSNAHNFIMSLPQNYDTLVGEKGVSLSGGQKQRVAIARAIVRKPNILVLDEATSALDTESEKIVQAALNDLMATTNMTTLVIAHRLSTIRHADKIVVFNEGHIVESGTHDELLAIEHGIYRNMYQIQQLRTEEEHQEVGRRGAEGGGNSTKLPRTMSSVSGDTDVSASDAETNSLDRKPFGLKDIARLSKPELKYLLVGVLGTCVGGLSMPATALVLTGMLTSMTTQYGKWERSGDTSYLDSMYDDVQLYGILFVVIAVVVAIFMFLQTYCFKLIEEKITTRLRTTNFEALCRQNVGFFDEQENATGALTADLATNATKVALLSGESQARVFQAVFTLAGALVISFGFGSWLLTLVMLAILPFMVFGNIARMKQMEGGGAISDDLALPGAHASEVLSNIRTVAALGIEQKSAEVFEQLLEEPLKKGSKEAQYNGLSLGFSSFIMMAAYALIFWFGAQKVNDGAISFTELFRTLMAIMLSVQTVSSASAFMGDAPKAFKAGSTITALQERVTPIDSFSQD
ncbi:hypothetical protein BBJ28_00004173, partial [Nothophytophthora sp. Chile5]